MAALAEGGCPRLRALSLRSNDLGPQGLAHLLAGVQQGCLGKLERLDLAVNALGDDAVHALLPLLFTPAYLPNLIEADLTFNGLDARRAALQLAAVRITHPRAAPLPALDVKLERKSAVPIVRRAAAPPTVAPMVVAPAMAAQQQQHMPMAQAQP